MSKGSTLRCSPACSSSAASPPAPQSAPAFQLRRMASFTQFFRSGKPPAAAQPVDKPPRTFYVPTHAASSFARTAAPPRTIHEDDETALSNRLQRRQQSSTRSTEEEADDYAAFLADAEARDRARQAVGWVHLGPGDAAAAGRCGPGAAPQRDSAYYSAGSRSSVSGPLQQQAQHRNMLSPCPGNNASTTAGRTLRRQPSTTLGRRISQYIKPPREDDVAEVDRE